MPVPFFQDIMLPLLEAIADGQEHQLRSVRQNLAPRFSLTEDELQEKTPSGGNFLFANRVAWASLHLNMQVCWKVPREVLFKLPVKERESWRQNRNELTSSFFNNFLHTARRMVNRAKTNRSPKSQKLKKHRRNCSNLRTQLSGGPCPKNCWKSSRRVLPDFSSNWWSIS